MAKSIPRELLLGLALFALLLLTHQLLRPGLTGRWMLDDRLNLHRLSEVPDQPDWADLAYQIGYYDAHRLLARATFFLQRHSWKSNPGDFKHVNLMIHLLNGVLLFWLLLRLGELMAWRNHVIWLVALMAAAFWLVHPLHLSTIFYVVQRMTQMAATFGFAGVLAYLHGRRSLIERMRDGGSLWPGLAWTSLGVGLGTILAVQCKETGVLLPLLVAVIEFTLLPHLPRPPGWRWWAALFLLLPQVVIGLYFAVSWTGLILAEYAFFDFTMAERLLTQPRVLVDYLGQILLPNPDGLSLHHDDFQFSRSWNDPPDTALSIALVFVLVGSALRWRRLAPVYSFAILWFFAGHLLESSFVALDLYFEHRNYMPMAGPALAVAYYAVTLRERVDRATLRRIIAAGGLLYLTLLAFISGTESTLWGQPWRQLEYWAAKQPLSQRAQAGMALFWRQTQMYHRAAADYARMARLFDTDVTPYMQWLELNCLDETVPIPPLDAVLARARVSRANAASIGMIDRLLSGRDKGHCGYISYPWLQELITALLENPRFGFKRHLHYRMGDLHAFTGNLDRAMASLDRVFELHRHAFVPLQQAEWLFSAGLYDDALRYLDKADQVAFNNPLTGFLDSRKVAELRATIATVRRLPPEQARRLHDSVRHLRVRSAPPAEPL